GAGPLAAGCGGAAFFLYRAAVRTGPPLGAPARGGRGAIYGLGGELSPALGQRLSGSRRGAGFTWRGPRFLAGRPQAGNHGRPAVGSGVPGVGRDAGCSAVRRPAFVAARSRSAAAGDCPATVRRRVDGDGALRGRKTACGAQHAGTLKPESGNLELRWRRNPKDVVPNAGSRVERSAHSGRRAFPSSRGPTGTHFAGGSRAERLFLWAAQEEGLDDHLVSLVTRLGGLVVFRDLTRDSAWVALDREEAFRK